MFSGDTRAKTAEEAKEIPPQSHGNSMIETGLIIASAIILVILAVPTLQGVVLLNRVPDANDTESLEKLGLDRSQIDGAITVNVTGKRFFWVFEYPQYGIVTANELVFPASKAVRINLRTEDVIHSFWVPKLAGKMDLMPGQENFMWFIADQSKIIGDSDAVSAMPAVHDGTMRAKVFAKQKFTDEFEPVEVCFMDSVQNTAVTPTLTCPSVHLPRQMKILINGLNVFRMLKIRTFKPNLTTPSQPMKKDPWFLLLTPN